VNVFAQNNGIIAFTLCASRMAGVATAIWLFLFGVLGKVIPLHKAPGHPPNPLPPLPRTVQICNAHEYLVVPCGRSWCCCLLAPELSSAISSLVN